MEDTTIFSLSVINILYILILIVLISIVWILDNTIRKKINNLYQNPKVIDMKNKEISINTDAIDLYNVTKDNSKLEDYFISNIYLNLSEKVRNEQVFNDYLTIFINAVNSVLNNKLKFTNFYTNLDNPKSLQLICNLPLIKFAKYSNDYSLYLEKLDSNEFYNSINKIFPNFQHGKEYFIDVKISDFKTAHVHVTECISKSIILYSNHMNDVNECLYNNICVVTSETM